MGQIIVNFEEGIKYLESLKFTELHNWLQIFLKDHMATPPLWVNPGKDESWAHAIYNYFHHSKNPEFRDNFVKSMNLQLSSWQGADEKSFCYLFDLLDSAFFLATKDRIYPSADNQNRLKKMIDSGELDNQEVNGQKLKRLTQLILFFSSKKYNVKNYLAV